MKIGKSCLGLSDEEMEPPKIRYRPFEAEDIFGLLDVNLDPFTNSFNIGVYTEFCTKNPLLSRVAVNEANRILGYILGFIKRDDSEGLFSHICAISVAQAFRGSGISHELMKHFETFSREQLCKYVSLYVKITNDRALAFYRRRNYKVCSTAKHYYGYDNHALVMKLELA